MTASNFPRALAKILTYEGGFSDNAADLGGVTDQGITLTTLSHFLGRQASVSELQSMSDQLVSSIYHGTYWAALQCDALPPGVDLMVFDAAVQHGPGRAAKFLQSAIGATADGVIGPSTLAAVGLAKPADIVETISAEREGFYKSLKTFSVFGKGWLSRLTNVTATASGWANGA